MDEKHLHLTQENIYGDKYDIHDNPNATFHLGGAKKQQQTETDTEEESKDGKLADALPQKEMAFMGAVTKVVAMGLIQNKQDFEAVRCMMQEMNIYDKMPRTSFLQMLNGAVDLPEKIKPSESNLKCVNIGGGQHPNWKVVGASPEYIASLVKIGSVFKDTYKLFAGGN